MLLACSWNPLLLCVLVQSITSKGRMCCLAAHLWALTWPLMAAPGIIWTHLILKIKYCRISLQKGVREEEEADKMPSALLSESLNPGPVRCFVRHCTLQNWLSQNVTCWGQKLPSAVLALCKHSPTDSILAAPKSCQKHFNAFPFCQSCDGNCSSMAVSLGLISMAPPLLLLAVLGRKGRCHTCS